MYSVVTVVNDIMYLKVAKRVDLKSSYYGKKYLSEVMNVN